MLSFIFGVFGAQSYRHKGLLQGCHFTFLFESMCVCVCVAHLCPTSTCQPLAQFFPFLLFMKKDGRNESAAEKMSRPKIPPAV